MNRITGTPPPTIPNHYPRSGSTTNRERSEQFSNSHHHRPIQPCRFSGSAQFHAQNCTFPNICTAQPTDIGYRMNPNVFTLRQTQSLKRAARDPTDCRRFQLYELPTALWYSSDVIAIDRNRNENRSFNMLAGYKLRNRSAKGGEYRNDSYLPFDRGRRRRLIVEESASQFGQARWRGVCPADCRYGWTINKAILIRGVFNQNGKGRVGVDKCRPQRM